MSDIPLTLLSCSTSTVVLAVVFRSTLRQSHPNKAGLKCPSVCMYVRPSVHKSFLDFNEIWRVGRGWWVMQDGMQYDPIQGQSRSRWRALQSWKSGHFQTLSSSPFTMRAGNWPQILDDDDDDDYDDGGGDTWWLQIQISELRVWRVLDVSCRLPLRCWRSVRSSSQFDRCIACQKTRRIKRATGSADRLAPIVRPQPSLRQCCRGPKPRSASVRVRRLRKMGAERRQLRRGLWDCASDVWHHSWQWTQMVVGNLCPHCSHCRFGWRLCSCWRYSQRVTLWLLGTSAHRDLVAIVKVKLGNPGTSQCGLAGWRGCKSRSELKTRFAVC